MLDILYYEDSGSDNLASRPSVGRFGKPLSKREKEFIKKRFGELKLEQKGTINSVLAASIAEESGDKRRSMTFLKYIKNELMPEMNDCSLHTYQIVTNIRKNNHNSAPLCTFFVTEVATGHSKLIDICLENITFEDFLNKIKDRFGKDLNISHFQIFHKEKFITFQNDKDLEDWIKRTSNFSRNKEIELKFYSA
ncbi:hypothetical protein ABK040_014289 [Willaertia magna]